MDRFRIWLIPGVIVLLAIGALVYFRGQLPGQLEPTPGDGVIEVEVEESKPKGFAKPVKEDLTEQKKAEEDADAMAAALHSGNIADCALITWDEAMKKQCEDNLNFASVLKAGDEEACKRLHDEVMQRECLDQVYLNAATKQKNIALCEKIDDAALRSACNDQVSVLLARNATSINDCANISSEALKSLCEDEFYMKSSTKEQDLTGCDSISDPILREQCRNTVTKNIEVIEQSKVAATTTTLTLSSQEILDKCNAMTGDKAAMCKDAVYPKLAFDSKDLSYCDQMSSPEKISDCKDDQGEKINTYLLRQALATNNRSLCDQISDNQLKETCKNS